MNEETLALYVGRVVMNDVRLENQLRTLYLVLVGPESVAHVLAPAAFGSLLNDCCLLVDAHDLLTPEQREWAQGALADAREVHELRNRFAHDLFGQRLDQSGELAEEWNRVRFKGRGVRPFSIQPIEASAFDAVLERQQRVYTRIQSLWLEVDVLVNASNPLFGQGPSEDGWRIVRGVADASTFTRGSSGGSKGETT